MTYRDLHEFVDLLEAKGELHRVKSEVSAELEITEITDMMSKSPGGGKALLFERVRGSRFPVLTNAFGSERRMALALETDSLDALASRIAGLLEMPMPSTFMGKIGAVPEIMGLAKCLPKVKRSSHPPCQEVVLTGDEVDLGSIPVLKCWPQDGGRFVTLPVVFTKSVDGRRNAGMYRLQVYDRNTTGMHWHIHKDGSHNFSGYRREGRRMEVAVAIGTAPAITYAATAPMPQGLDEMLLAGFIRGAPVDLVKCRTVDLEVPATSEFVLEGYVDPEDRRIEGPFGDHTGYYSLKAEYPVFHVTAITHRRDAIYPATVVGRPPMEDCYLAKATERIFLPPLRVVVPEVVDQWMPWEGVFHNIVVVSVRKEYPLHARKVMSALWGSGQMSFAKMIAVVDEEISLKDVRKVFAHLLDTIDPWTDLQVTDGVLDVLDHSAPRPLFGGKLGVDATSRVEEEIPRGRGRYSPKLGESELLETLRELDPGFVSCRRVGMGRRNPLVLIGLRKGGRGTRHFLERLEACHELAGEGLMVLFDDIDLQDDSLCLWKFFNNVDPQRDIRITERTVYIDASRKGLADGHAREWPDEIEMSPEVRKAVRERSAELGISDLYKR
ncbi:MAG: menaquinone biosynthesis decarboxylase [Methanomassiliicoccus sp.]|nr:menaquinone biosynthesis decarboxylase [Methanomassiliicoccus sp.]